MVADLLPLHEETGIPIVFDYFHHKLHPGALNEEKAFTAAYNTWDMKPVFHYQVPERKTKMNRAKKKPMQIGYMSQLILMAGK
jgi:UV DNA damage endonuclease